MLDSYRPLADRSFADRRLYGHRGRRLPSLATCCVQLEDLYAVVAEINDNDFAVLGDRDSWRTIQIVPLAAEYSEHGQELTAWREHLGGVVNRGRGLEVMKMDC